jgi:regulator of RNase E activity RraA
MQEKKMKKLDNQRLTDVFSNLSTPLIADAVVRLGISPRTAPPGIRPLIPGTQIAGQVLPVKHYGSVDVFFESMASANQRDVLVIDNQGRQDEGCIGDLTALEARAFGIAAMIIWGCHRDTKVLIEIGFPIFSYGACSFGPLRVDQQEFEAPTKTHFGSIEIALGDIVFADDDGVIFVPRKEIERLLKVAGEINATERRQAQAITSGKTLHKQFQFDEFLEKRKHNPAYTFRKHLRDIGGAIEE